MFSTILGIAVNGSPEIVAVTQELYSWRVNFQLQGAAPSDADLANIRRGIKDQALVQFGNKDGIRDPKAPYNRIVSVQYDGLHLQDPADVLAVNKAVSEGFRDSELNLTFYFSSPDLNLTVTPST